MWNVLSLYGRFNGTYSYIEETWREVCQHMHAYGTYQLHNTYIIGLKPNHTIARPVTLAGNVDADRACKENTYSDPYGTWTDVVVLVSIKITLQENSKYFYRYYPCHYALLNANVS
ncbi:hypothetical protein P5V15_004252 [Pogonomyrmex californicus]